MNLSQELGVYNLYLQIGRYIHKAEMGHHQFLTLNCALIMDELNFTIFRIHPDLKPLILGIKRSNRFNRKGLVRCFEMYNIAGHLQHISGSILVLKHLTGDDYKHLMGLIPSKSRFEISTHILEHDQDKVDGKIGAISFNKITNMDVTINMRPKSK